MQISRSVKESNFQQYFHLSTKRELRSIAEIGDRSRDSYQEEDRRQRR
jgi:hypothetical protein